MQIRAPKAPREAQRLCRPPLEGGRQRISADFDARRGPFGPSGEMGPRPPGLDFGGPGQL
eukprot:2517004-Alexandrium_andersonii.AAC.1